MRKSLLPLALVGLLGLTALPGTASAAHEELVVTGLAQNGKLVTFLAGTGERLSQTKRVSGLPAGFELASIDYRPSNGLLYGVAVDGRRGEVVTLDPTSAVATPLGIGFPITGAVSIDINPAADRLRVVSTDDFNYRLNVDPGAAQAVFRDGALSYGPGSDPTVVGVAYTNNDNDPSTPTELFDVDAALDQLALQNPPNAGTLTARGPLGTDIATQTGFDVYSEAVATGVRNIALLSDRDEDGTRVSVVNLTTGAVNQASTVLVQGAPVLDIAIDPAQ